MKILQKKLTILIAFTAIFLGFLLPAFAQQNAQSVYNSTVDLINCETIRFIHREAGRAEIANNMMCTSFESILKSIPEDEGSTTAKVAKDIDAYKTKFKADGDLAAQLDAIIAYVNKKIEAKPRKGNVADFKQKLQDYKTDALDNMSGASTTTTNTVTPAPTGTNDAAIDEDTETEDNVAMTPTETTTKSGTDWLGWLSLIISLLSLGLSAYLYSQLGKLREMTSRPVLQPADNDGNKPRGPLVNESAANYQLIETKMYQEIAKLGREFDEKLAAVTASTGYTQPENFSGREEKKSDFLPTPVDQADAPIVTTAQRQPEPEPVQEEEKPLPVVLEEVVEEPVEDEEETEDEPEPVVQNTVRSDNADVIAPLSYSTSNVEEEEDETIALPDYKYVGLPLADGSFSPESFTDMPQEESLYEVEMYEDVPNKAFFSPLQYPEILEKTLADPEQYLAPCCMFLNEADGKQNITVIEEGRLRRQGERWYIYEKARIRFD
ncbi:MAG: hypothetical protein EOP53_00505 [Sphingobacteriales bacterium]|nr:MAG: hypothetical protein EOP53_00505 [Sphingobacteriales bacterium]